MKLGKDCNCGRIVYFDTVEDTQAVREMEIDYWLDVIRTRKTQVQEALDILAGR